MAKGQLQKAIEDLKHKIEAAVRDIAMAQAELNVMQRTRSDLETIRDAKPKRAPKKTLAKPEQSESLVGSIEQAIGMKPKEKAS